MLRTGCAVLNKMDIAFAFLELTFPWRGAKKQMREGIISGGNKCRGENRREKERVVAGLVWGRAGP